MAVFSFTPRLRLSLSRVLRPFLYLKRTGLVLSFMRLARGSSSVCGAASRGGIAARPATAARAKVLFAESSPLSIKTTHASSSPSSSSFRRPLVAASASPGDGSNAQATSPFQYPLNGAPGESDREGEGKSGRRRRERVGDAEMLSSSFALSRAEFFFLLGPRPPPKTLTLFFSLFSTTKIPTQQPPRKSSRSSTCAITSSPGK